MRRWIKRLFALFKGRCEAVRPLRVAWNGRPLADEVARIPEAPDHSTLIVEFPVGGSAQVPAPERRPD
jgi:hypothetical protein